MFTCSCVAALAFRTAKARNAFPASPRFKEARRLDTPVWPAQESGQRLARAMERGVASMTSDLKGLNNIFGGYFEEGNVDVVWSSEIPEIPAS